MAKKIATAYDSADYLKDDKMILAYLREAFDDGDPVLIVHAIGTAARAKGMGKIARSAGVSRESLYKSLSEKGKPEFGTVLKSLKAMGIELKVAKAA